MSKKPKSTESITWEFKEQVNTKFSTTWYVGMAVGFLILMALAIFVMKAWTFAVLLIVLAISLVVYIRRPARTIKYLLDKDEIFIDDNRRKVSDFKAFGLIQNSRQLSIILIPTKRFAPGVILDFTEDKGEEIVDFFGARLPMQEIQPNFVDNIINRLGL